jgi:hypothetical protein
LKRKGSFGDEARENILLSFRKIPQDSLIFSAGGPLWRPGYQNMLETTLFAQTKAEYNMDANFEGDLFSMHVIITRFLTYFPCI